MRTLLSSLVLVALVACTTSGGQKLSVQQQAFQAYGTFVVLEEQAARLVQDPVVPERVKLNIRAADAIAKPAADAILDAALAADEVRIQRELASGLPKINSFRTEVQEAQNGPATDLKSAPGAGDPRQ